MAPLAPALLLLALPAEPLSVRISSCVGEMMQESALVEALALELSPQPLAVATGTGTPASLSIGCQPGPPPLLVMTGSGGLFQLESTAVPAQELPRAVALLAAELSRVAAPRARTSTEAPAAVANAPQPPREPADWSWSVRGDTRLVTSGGEGVIGLGMIAEQRALPIGFRAGAMLLGIRGDDKTQLGAEVRVGASLELLRVGRTALEAELTASAGVAGLPGRSGTFFVAGMLAPTLRWPMDGGLELLTSAGVAYVPGTLLVALGVGLSGPM